MLLTYMISIFFYLNIKSVHLFGIMLVHIIFVCYSHGSDSSSEEGGERINDYAGAQVLKIRRCPELISIVEKNDLNLWSGNTTHLDVMVPGNKINLIKWELSKQYIQYYVSIQDLDKTLRQHRLATKFRSGSSDKKDYQMNWENYQSLDVIYDYLEYLADKFPEIVKVGIMGKTNEERPLKYMRILSENTSANVVFIDGGIHAREWVSPSSVTYIIKELVENRNKLPKYLVNLEVYVLPVMNPDGYAYTFSSDRLWRKNRSGHGLCIGTDINRNFDYNWAKKGASQNPCSEVFRGRAAASEAETIAVSTFLLQLKGKIEAYISFHSYGQYILIPFGYDYNSQAPDFNELKSVGESAAEKIFSVGGKKYRVGNTAHMLYPASGGSDDWAKAIAGAKYSYTVELRDKGKFAFLLPPEDILPTAIDALEAFKVIASAAYHHSTNQTF